MIVGGKTLAAYFNKDSGSLIANSFLYTLKKQRRKRGSTLSDIKILFPVLY